LELSSELQLLVAGSEKLERSVVKWRRIYIEKAQKGESQEKEQAQAGGAAEGEGEAGFPLSWEPNVGLDPRTLGS